MNQLQEKDVFRAVSAVAYVRRTLQELQAFGWKLTIVNQALSDFDKQAQALEETSQAIKSLKPRSDKSHEKELSALLDKENYLVESLTALSNSAREGLKAEQIAFFEARDNLVYPLREQIEQADRDVQAAFEVLTDRLQRRWADMLKLHQVGLALYSISQEHNTSPQLGEPDLRLPKPFQKKDVNTWRAFVQVYLAQLVEVLANSEHVTPRDVAEGAYRK